MITANRATSTHTTSMTCWAAKSYSVIRRGFMAFFSTSSSIFSAAVYWMHLSRMENSRGSAFLETPRQISLVYVLRVITPSDS